MEVTEVLSRNDLKKLLSFRLRQGLSETKTSVLPYETLEEALNKHRNLLQAPQEESQKPVYLNFALNPDPVSCVNTMNLLQSFINLKSASEWTLVEELVLNEKLLCIQHLAQSSKINLEVASESGETLLHLAAARDDWELMEFLLERRLNPMVENGLGNTCIDVAIRYGSIKVLKILFEHINYSEKESYNKKLVSKLPIIQDQDFIRCHQYINPQARYPVKFEQNWPVINKLLNNQIQLEKADLICLLISEMLDELWIMPNGKLIFSFTDLDGNKLEKIQEDLELRGRFDREKLEKCVNHAYKEFQSMVLPDDCHGQKQLKMFSNIMTTYLQKLEQLAN